MKTERISSPRMLLRTRPTAIVKEPETCVLAQTEHGMGRHGVLRNETRQINGMVWLLGVALLLLALLLALLLLLLLALLLLLLLLLTLLP